MLIALRAPNANRASDRASWHEHHHSMTMSVLMQINRDARIAPFDESANEMAAYATKAAYD
ncbi:MAG: hypothetical protein K2Y71_23260 [Xanthobacteraceae bacterium]|nr:hypothetical protein [Xanthobacteraceae bacterium]